ncbi:MAG: response regulator [Candidatus Rokubacteria bacterium]|nr:response regulator [Candidatus Rokubacteria bacterium]
MSEERRRRILVVDDDAVITSTLEKILRGQGYEVATATDGVEAIELARATPFDFVVLDLVMPRMDGLTTLHYLTTVAPKARVLILSAHLGRNWEAEALRLGAAAVLPKPPDIPKLLRLCDDLSRQAARETSDSPRPA